MNTEDIFILTACLFGSLLGVYSLIPKIVGVARNKHLMDNPNRRSSHTIRIPRLGGVAFFATFVLGMFLLRDYDVSNITISIVSGMLIVFLIGLKDDLVVITPATKFVAQVLACSFIFLNIDLQVDTLFGVFGIYEINTVVSLFIMAFFMIYLINAFNLIDGIDGLASILAIVTYLVYGIVFFYLDLYFYVGIALIGIGTQISFLIYNLSFNKNKIFMGDSGSMLLGLTTGLLSIKFLSTDASVLETLPIKIENVPILMIVILFIPLFDTGRIFLVRILSKRNPFQPDRQHIHHILIDYFKLSHKTVSFILGFFGIFLIAVFFVISAFFSSFVLLLVMALIIITLLFGFKHINPLLIRKKKIRSVSQKD